MSTKIYKKRGATNYQERKLLKQLEPAIEKLIAQDPTFSEKFKAAENFDELKHLHAQYCIDDVEFTESGKDDEGTATEPTNSGSETGAPDYSNTDPMNRANPKVREYVLNDHLDGASKKPDIGGMPEIGEPRNQEEAFRFPDEDLDPKELEKRKKAEQSKNGGTNGPGNNTGNGAPKNAGNGINPAFDELTAARKKKSTKRFAKYIVEIVATLMEHGYVWWVTKDINEAALAELELKGAVDPEYMEMLVNLSEEQEVTIRQFFALQVNTAKQNAVVSRDDRDELADALAEVLEEKGIAPSPTQNLIIVALGVVSGKALPAFMQKMQCDSVLNQIKAMTKRDAAERGHGPEQRRATSQEKETTQEEFNGAPGEEGVTDQQPVGATEETSLITT